jgi:HSP20 family protein
MTKLFAQKDMEEMSRVPAEGEPSRWKLWDPIYRITSFLKREKQPTPFTPDFEFRETKDGFIFKADVPGFKEEDIEISMTGSRLTISGKREASK